MRSSTSALLILVSHLALSCSSPVPPTMTRRSAIPFERGAEILLQAQRQRPRILQSLEAAGLKPVNERAESGYVLIVSVGGSRAGRDCGSVNNVAYDLRGSGQRMVIKGRGNTGSCTPNIFDAMSRRLAASMTE